MLPLASQVRRSAGSPALRHAAALHPIGHGSSPWPVAAAAALDPAIPRPRPDCPPSLLAPSAPVRPIPANIVGRRQLASCRLKRDPNADTVARQHGSERTAANGGTGGAWRHPGRSARAPAARDRSASLLGLRCWPETSVKSALWLDPSNVTLPTAPLERPENGGFPPFLSCAGSHLVDQLEQLRPLAWSARSARPGRARRPKTGKLSPRRARSRPRNGRPGADRCDPVTFRWLKYADPPRRCYAVLCRTAWNQLENSQLYENKRYISVVLRFCEFLHPSMRARACVCVRMRIAADRRNRRNQQ